MTFTTKDVESALEGGESFKGFSQYLADNTDYYKDHDGWTTVDSWGELDGSGKVELNGETYDWETVTIEGGGEGSGEYTFIVIEIDGRLFRKEGYYASHYGTDWDGAFEEVEAYEKTVTDYRPV